MSARPLPQSAPVPDSQRRAIAHLFDEYDRARAERDAAETRLTRFAETLSLLIGNLPARDRVEYERRLRELQIGGAVDGRGGEVHNNVIELFTKKTRAVWTINDVQTELEKSGVAADQKTVSNSLAYLARSGRLMRVGRGQYVVRGIGCGLEGEDRDDGTIRTSEHDV